MISFSCGFGNYVMPNLVDILEASDDISGRGMGLHPQTEADREDLVL